MSLSRFLYHSVHQSAKATLCIIVMLMAALAARAQMQELPQEMVYVHMDNTCYFLGDTVYYKAYVQRSDTGQPTNLSGVLYVEMLNQDGYLVERQVLRLKDGQADGSFCLADTLYAGFYEMRAYTRWQLNFGRHERPHRKIMDQWFLKKEYAQEFFVDYDKLYSRVFPVYDKPEQAGEYYRDMTTRPLRRDYKELKRDVSPHVGWYPEGGDLVAGLRQRVAFEVNDGEGVHLRGRVAILGNNGDTLCSASTENRGRGVMEVMLEAHEKPTAVFIDAAGKATKVDMPSVLSTGAVMTVTQTEERILADIQVQGVESDSIFLAVTACGHKRILMPYKGQQMAISTDSLPAGVTQLTLRRGGRTLADRLVFVHKPAVVQAPLRVGGLQDSYQALEHIALDVEGPAGSTVSMAVRDVKSMDPVSDNGNIMTEMLLSSHIKGFVEDPLYYFEADDTLHRRHLNLLLMVQGWRRFGHELKELAEPYEVSQIIRGEVNKYTSLDEEDAFYLNTTMDNKDRILRGLSGPLPVCGTSGGLLLYDLQPSFWSEDYLLTLPLWYRQQFIHIRPDGIEEALPIISPIETYHLESLKAPGEVSHLHAEFVQPGSAPVYGDMEVKEDGKFLIQAPHFDGYCMMHIAAATPKHALKAEPGQGDKGGKKKPGAVGFQWILPDESAYPDYSVRIQRCYPNFVSPYSYYQTQFVDEEDDEHGPQGRIDDVTYMQEVRVKAKRRIMRKWDPSKPVLVLDAYDAYNRIVDAGLTCAHYAGSMSFSSTLSRLLFGDMGMPRAYDMERRWDGRNMHINSIQVPQEQYRYNRLAHLDKVYLYSDYSPRMSGSQQYAGDDVPCVVVDIHQFENSGAQYSYRDRFSVLWGYDRAQDFYHPDYSLRPLPAGEQDHRRTLYWNPNLQLDQHGRATVSFYNNSGNTTLNVDIEGQAADGTLLWNER